MSTRDLVVRMRDLSRRASEGERHEWAGPTRGCRVYRDATQSIPDNTWTPITFTTEIFDKGNCWAVGQPTRLVAPRDGYYLAEANVEFNNAGDTDGQRGVAIASSGGDYLAMVTRAGAGAGEPVMLLQVDSGLIYLAAGGYVTVQVYQNSGGAMNIMAASLQYQMACHATLVRMH